MEMGQFSHYQAKQGGSLQRVFRPEPSAPDTTEEDTLPKAIVWNEPESETAPLLQRNTSSANLDIASFPSELLQLDTTRCTGDIEMTTFGADDSSDENIHEFLTTMLWTSFLKASENK